MTVVRGAAPRSQFTVKILSHKKILVVAQKNCTCRTNGHVGEPVMSHKRLLHNRLSHKRSCQQTGHVVGKIVGELVMSSEKLSANRSCCRKNCRTNGVEQPVVAQKLVDIRCFYHLRYRHGFPTVFPTKTGSTKFFRRHDQ